MTGDLHSALRERCYADVWIGVTQQEARELLSGMYDSSAREHALGEEVEGLRAQTKRLRAELARVQDEANTTIRRLAGDKAALRAGFDALRERSAHLATVLAEDIECTPCRTFLKDGGDPCDEYGDRDSIKAALGVS